MTVIYCQATYQADFQDTTKCVQRVSPHVDFTIIVEDGSLTDEQRQWLKAQGCIVKTFEFKDNLPEMRQQYLEEAKKIDPHAWIAVSDPDELYSEELAKNLRPLVEQGEAEGYNMLPIHVRDQFESIEWLDELDRLKEVPGGYRETDYWKPLLLFQLNPDTQYSGVGETKNVHETLESSVPWRAKNLPKKYFYVHKKSALKIWRNASRNMFISGGGDNVGALNKFWVELRGICDSLGVKTWRQFEDSLKKGDVDEELKKWLVDALQAPPTRWGIETRETAKYYFAMHPKEITPEIKQRIDTVPKLTPEIEVENYVTRCYYQVLGRHPDAEGLRNYADAILSGRLKREVLPDILKASREYRKKMGEPPIGREERVRLQVPVDVDIRISEADFVKALRKSDVYWRTIKPRLDLGKFVETFVKDKEEFYQWFYKNKDDTSFSDLSKWMVPRRELESLAVCIMGHHQGFPMILESVNTVKPYADEIHVQGDDFAEEDVETLKKLGCEVHFEPWKEHFSDYKNRCISHATARWVLILDHDEVPTPEMAQTLREIVTKSDFGRLYNIVEFESVNVTLAKDGTVVSENRGRGKPLLHVKVENPYYGNPHIWLKPDYYPWVSARVPLAYKHIKEEGIDVVRAIRNVFLGGGGDNLREKNPLWVELRALTDELDIQTWKEFHGYLKKGNADSRLKEWLEKAYVYPWHDLELKAFKEYYYKLHPEEKS